MNSLSVLPACRKQHAAVLLALFSLAARAVEPTASASAPISELGVITVTGQSARGLRADTVEAGSFRGSDVMDVPSTVNVVTREALDQQAASGLYDAVRNTAGVTRQQNGGETWDQLVIRGIAVENRTNYRLNGSLPIMNFGQAMLEDKERVEVLKGASALYYGFAAPAGIVNYVTKRPTAKPLTSVSMNLDQYGTAILATDMSRRYGENDQYGLRLNAGGGAVGSYLDGVDSGNRRFAAAAFDWKVSNRLRLKTDLEYDHRKTTEQVGVTLPTAVNGVITLPHPVDPKKSVGPSDSKFETDAVNALLRADYALDDNWTLTFEGGHAQTSRDRNLATFRFTSAATVATGAGRIQGTSQHSLVKSDLVKSELFGTVDAFGRRHELTFGLSQTDKSQDAIYSTTYTVASQNLYSPVSIGSVVWAATPTSPTTAELNTTDTGFYAMDRIALSDHWQIIGGLRHSLYRSDQADNHYDVSKTTPMLAAVYRPLTSLSLYASYARGLEEGDTAPTGALNVGERMAPGVSKQYELGSRWQVLGDTLLSAAIFQIDRPGAYTGTDGYYVADGEQRYRGLELSTQGKITRDLGWLTSAQWLDPRFRKSAAAYVGKLPENAARRTASAFLTLDVAWVPGLTLNGGSYYTGRRPVDDLNQAWLPSVTLYAAGARYATHIFSRAVSWQLNIENLTDKEYWAGAGTRLAAGAPRTVKLGVKIDL
ncbi:TonB-dependent siderophore receptor [Uliginosibacterium sp. 31-12]|uniref:TonB-dependent siderophore receptor n=1 Tax=Uliginosibacterium sp. 31-12 TaxID=3062781 RepID=UPI0026E2DDBC|nr:TonB-dependent siderophore receptor [Uliginosibacterium sp. 31-12]MDO6385279.1 TonB-dependent siderophore receptor [Uliginosibacterium sp. 31-12]